MKIAERFVLSLGLVVLAVVPSHDAGGQDSAGGMAVPERTEYRRSFTWNAPEGDGVGRGLYLFRMGPASMSSTLIAETPDGRRVMLTDEVDPTTGSMKKELIDDATGWRASLVMNAGVTAKTLESWFRAAREALQYGEGRSVPVRFATSEGLLFDESVPVDRADQKEQIVAERLSARGDLAVLSDSVPPGLRDAVLFLDTSLSPDPLPWRDDHDNVGHGFRGAVEVVARALRAAPPGGEEPGFQRRWPMSVGEARKGFGSWTVDELELFSGFRTVSPETFSSERFGGSGVEDPRG